MLRRKKSQSQKKKGEQSNDGPQKDEGDPIATGEPPTVASPQTRRSSTPTADQHPSEPQQGGIEETDGRETKSKKEKTKKGDKKEKDKDQKSKVATFFSRKKSGHNIPSPTMTELPERQPSNDHTPTESKPGKLQGVDGVVCTASVDSTLVVNHESQIDQLKLEIENLTVKQNKKDTEIDSLRREKEKMVTEVREALDKCKSKEGRTPLQTHKLHAENELETTAEEKDRLAKCHEENISEIQELLRKGSKVKQVTEHIEATKEDHDREIENIKAKHDEEIDRLQGESLQCQHEKETEISDLKLQVQQAKEKAAELEAELEKLDKDKDKRYKEEMEKVQTGHAEECSRLREAKVQNETDKKAEIKVWKTKCHESEQQIDELATKLENLKTVKVEHEVELENISSEHAQELNHLREAKMKNETEKEAEIKLWKTKGQEAEQEIAELAKKVKNLEKVKEEHKVELKNIRSEHAQELSHLHEAKMQDISEKEAEVKLCKTKGREAEQEIAKLTKEVEILEKVKEEHEIELKNIKAKHIVESSNLSKENKAEVEQWKQKCEEAENEVKQLHERLEKLDKEREDDKTCALPPDHHMEQIKKLTCVIERAHTQHESEIAELTSNLEIKKKELVQQIEERNEELRHQLDEAKRVHSEQLQQVQVELENKHASEIAAMKVNYEEKQKKEDQSIEQQVQKRIDRLEKASRDKFREVKTDNETLKTEADKLKKEAEECLTVKKILEEKNETIKELEMQLKKSKIEKEQKEHKHNMTTASLKSNNERKQKEYESQLREKAEEIGSLSDQLDKSKQQVLALKHENNEQSEALKKLKEENNEYESKITNHTLEMAKLRSEFDKLSSMHKELQETYGQLEIEVEMKKELSATTGDECIHSEEGVHQGANLVKNERPQQHISDHQSDEEEVFHSLKSQNSLHQDNLTDTEKADLQCQISDRDRKIKELEDQLSECKQSKIKDFDEELPEGAKGASDANEKMVPLSKLTKLKEKYLEATEKVVKTEEKLVKVKAKHERERNELIEKLEDRQNQLKAVRQKQLPLPPYSAKDPVPLKEKDYETADHEVTRLKTVGSENVGQISSLEMQVIAIQPKKKENQSEEQNQTVKDWQQKFEAEQRKHKDGSAPEAELAEAKQKICDLEEEIGVYKSEVDAEKQNVQQEVEKSRHLEHKINQLRHEKVHLQEQLAGYDKMNEEVGILKASATNMLKRFRTFLGKGEAEHPKSEKVDLECDNITKRLSELMEELEVKEIQADIYKNDFEEERKEREEAAKNKDEEIAAMQTQFSETVKERNELQSQLAKAHQDIANVRAELESSKKLLEDALTNAEQDTEKHKQELSDIEQVLHHNHKEIQDEKARLDDKVHSLEDERAQTALERDQLRENRDKLKEERDELQKQVQDMCDESDKISSELKAKIKEAEIHAVEKNHIENEYHHLQEQLKELCCLRDALQSELTEVNEQLESASADKSTLESESLAKTQQVKQYKKQVDHYKVQLQESNARIEKYQVQLEQCNAKIEEYQGQLEQCRHELAYCQMDLKKQEEYEQNTADYVRAQYESKLSTLKLEVGALKREKADMEVQLRQQQIGTVAPDTASYVDQLQKEKAELYQKYISLRDRYDVLFQHNDQLVAVLRQNHITVPNAKTLPQAQQHATTSPYQERVTYDGRHYNRQGDPNKSVTAQAGIGAPPDHQLNYGHMQYQQGVGGVASSPPSMQRAGEGAVAAGDHHVHPHELLQEINLPKVAYSQGQPNTYSGGVVGHPSGGGEGVPVNYPQGYGEPQPPSAATYASTYPESQNYSGMGMRPSDDIGSGQQGLMTPEPETGRRVASGPHENALIKGINTEIHSVAAGVGRQVDRNPEMDSLSPQAPFDPNLICPMCRLQYRIGEIQKYRKHVKYCQGT